MTPRNLLLPMYHAVSDEPLPHLDQLYHVRNPARFSADLRFYLRHFRPAGVEELKRVINGETLPEPYFLISFDDGLREVYDIAAPLLRQYGLTAIIFINPAFVDNRDMMFRLKASALAQQFGSKGDPMTVSYENRAVFDEALSGGMDWRAYIQSHRPYMTMQQLTSLKEQGFLIGSHSTDHPVMNRLPFTEQSNQAFASIEFVIRHFKPELKLFAFPFTDDGVTSEFFSAIDEIMDASFGVAGLKQDSVKTNLQRIPLEDYRGRASSVLRFELCLATVRKMLGRNTIRRP